jgi:hypothetical protein
MTPMGFPTTVALDPILVAKTWMITKGIGLTPKRDVRWIMVAVINRIEVTSSTNAADIPPTTMSVVTRRTGLDPTYRIRVLTRVSKKWFSSRYPTKIIIPIKKRMMSSPANSIRLEISRRPKTKRREIPINAKGSRNGQKRIVPKMTKKKMARDRTWVDENPMREERRLTPKMINT